MKISEKINKAFRQYKLAISCSKTGDDICLLKYSDARLMARKTNSVCVDSVGSSDNEKPILRNTV